MQVYLDGHPVETIPVLPVKGALLCVAAPAEAGALLAQLGLQRPHGAQRVGTWFEAHPTFDYMSVTLPDMQTHGHLECYLARGVLVCVARREALQVLGIKKDVFSKYSPDLALHQFFTALNEHNAQQLRGIEEEIANLEDDVAQEDASRDYVAAISALRKKLMVRKRHHEALVTLLEDLEENENGIIAEEQLRYFHFQTNRANRLYQTVLNLRDYVTQVRESYQAQMDISLNKTMKFFTVITTIFLPLTLIAGWYGMNLQMPEYGFRHAYPVVVALSALIVIGTIVYFRKKKWF